MERVKSSQVHSIGHDAASNTLHVKFHARGCAAKNISCECGGGSTYSYPEVTAEQHAAFASAESIGKHFGQHFKKRAFTKQEVSV